MSEFSQEKKQKINDFLSKCEKININLGYNKNIDCYYYPEKNLYFIVINSIEESHFLQNLSKFKKIVFDELNNYSPNIEKDKIFIIDYSKQYLPGYEVININTTSDTFLHKNNNQNFRDFDTFLANFITSN